MKNEVFRGALLQVLARGENSRHQFKYDVTNANGVAAELVALANSCGGEIYLGVEDDGSIVGLGAAAVTPSAGRGGVLTGGDDSSW